MKNIILFHPKIGYMDCFRTKPSLPLNLLSAATLLSKKYKIYIIDQRVTSDWQKKLKDFVNSDTLCVGITSLTGKMIAEALKFSKFVKENFESIKVVWGGIHASLLPTQTISNRYIDFVVIGEAEVSFYNLVEAIDKNLDFKYLKGICYKKDGLIYYTEKQDFIDLNSLPFLPYELVDVEQYLPKYKNLNSLYFQSSRGCNFGCGYCYNVNFNKSTWRSFSASSTIERIKYVVSKYPSIQNIYFVDDNFFVDLERAKDIILGLKSLGLSWQVQGVDILSLKKMPHWFLKLIEESECLRITIGIESGSQKIRKFINKKGSILDIINVFKKLSKYKIIIYCSFLVGLPKETIKDIKKTINLIFYLLRINKNLRTSPFYIYTPYPGTSIFKNILQSTTNFKLPDKLEGWINYEWDQAKFKKNKNFYTSLHFATLFLDNKIKEYNTFFLIKFLYFIYRPIAILRVKNLFFKFMIEKHIFNLFKMIFKNI